MINGGICPSRDTTISSTIKRHLTTSQEICDGKEVFPLRMILVSGGINIEVTHDCMYPITVTTATYNFGPFLDLLASRCGIRREVDVPDS